MRGGQNTERSPTMRGTPLTSSGAICVPSSERHGRPASAAAWDTISDLPTPGGDSNRKLCSCAMHWTSFLAWPSVMVSSFAATVSMRWASCPG